MGETYFYEVLGMPARRPTLPGSHKRASNAPKGSRAAGNSKNYKKRSKIERNLPFEGAVHASTPPCTPWSLFSSKSAVCATSTAAWVAMLVVTHQAVSACHRPVTRPNGYRIITGENFVTRPCPRDPRTCEPARVSIPMSITTANKYLGENAASGTLWKIV